MLVKDLMATNVVVIKQDETYEEVVRKLVNHRITGAPVVDSDENLIGIITEWDLSQILYALYDALSDGLEGEEEKEKKLEEIKKTDISDFIITDVQIVTPDMELMEAGRIMLTNDIDRLPVMEDEKIVGIIGRRKLFREIFKQNLNF